MILTVKTTFFAFLAASILLGAAACQVQNQTNRQSANLIANIAESATANRAAAQQSALNPEASEPLQTIKFKSADNLSLVGSLYPANKSNAAAVLMLHQWGSNRAAYNDLASQFQKQGITVLTVDGRGFGESIKTVDNAKVAVSQSNESIAAMKTDVAEAVKFLIEQNGVDPNRIGIIGASYGSSLALLYAADNASIKAVALLSPGVNYFGNLPTEPAAQKYGARSILIVAAEDDGDSARAARRLDELVGGDKHRLQIYSRGGHGTGLLSAGVGLERLLIEFFAQNL